jgi:1,4-alpha-glucan branching enzyme
VEKALEHARLFLENQTARFSEAVQYMKEVPVSLCACNADNFGRFWYEGPQFIEALFRLSGGYREIQFLTPAEYLYKQNISGFENSIPEFSSRGTNGYAEMWLDSSNDWLYRHLIRSTDRMIELAERFPDDTGLKERALNQAAREIFLAAASDWPKMLYQEDYAEYARAQIEGSLRNFTTIYEALGSNYISTEWLTTLEKRHNLFPNINYRVFRRKR